MTVELVVIGAGGFGRETLDIVEAINRVDTGAISLLGVVDSGPSEVNLDRLRDRNIAYLGTENDWFRQGRTSQFVVAIGSPAIRALVAQRFESHGFEPATLVHPLATIGSQNTIGAGTVIGAGVQISTNVTLGRHVHINANATIGHDTVLGDCVSINPGAIVSGEVTVADAVLVGAGAVILQQLSIGRSSTVGAAACVVSDVPASVTVKGVPAR